MIPNANFVFPTSTRQVIGSLGGLAGADAVCQARAMAAGLPGTYVAWLSSSTVNARDRLGSARGWVRPDGLPVADTISDLISPGHILFPPRVTDLGEALTAVDSKVVTSTDVMGQVFAGDTCADWSSTTGNARSGTAAGGATYWTFDTGFAACSMSERLLCFGIDRQTPVSWPPIAGRRAFRTSSTLQLTGGIAQADNACQLAANGAGLIGTFRALIADDGLAAASRFDTLGPTWVRLDGVPIAPTAEDMMQGALDVTITITELGSTAYGYFHSGASTVQLPGTAATTCSGWTLTTGTNHRIGWTAWLDEIFASSTTMSCALAGALICLEP